jgi:hypothetical protein
MPSSPPKYKTIELNGKVKMVFDQSDTMICPACHKHMPRVFIWHDGVPMLAGFGSCKCRSKQ